jgi:two-component system response regulator NreC
MGRSWQAADCSSAAEKYEAAAICAGRACFFQGEDVIKYRPPDTRLFRREVFMSGIIRVLIADDHEDRSIHRLIDSQNDMEVVGEVTDGSQILDMVTRRSPDILLLDLSLSGAGLRVLEQLGEIRPQTRSIVLALNEDISLLRSVLAMGSLGYVVFRGAKAELLSVIRKIYRGRSYAEVPTGGLPVDPRLDPDSAFGKELREKLDLLSKRESEVLKAVAYGYTNREIAEWLGISVKSVETYRFRVSEKLNFNSRADLVRFALEAGLLTVQDDGLPPPTSTGDE